MIKIIQSGENMNILSSSIFDSNTVYSPASHIHGTDDTARKSLIDLSWTLLDGQLSSGVASVEDGFLVALACACCQGGNHGNSPPGAGSFALASEPDGSIDYGAASYTYFTTGTGDARIDGVLTSRQWNDTELTYSFPDDYEGDYIDGGIYYQAGSHPNFLQFNAKQQAATVIWLNEFSSFANLTFTELDGADGALDEDQEAVLRFANSDDPGTAYAYYPSNNAVGGDSWYGSAYDNNLSLSYKDPDRGEYGDITIGHEIGHALGLSHPHDAVGAFSTVPSDWDGMEFSIMSYNSYIGQDGGGYANGTGSYAITPMMLDIAALQFMYGANWTHNGGNTVYTWDTATGAMSVNDVAGDGSVANIIFMTLWDGGGVDEYDLSNYTTDLAIDLTPGGWSDFDVGGNAQRALLSFITGDYARAHVYNALQYNDSIDSLIENATGGTGDDDFIGNVVANILDGGEGNDSLTGNDGDDTLIGGIGNDTALGGVGNDELDLGEGTDVAVFSGNRADFTVTTNGAGEYYIEDNRSSPTQGADTLIGVESVVFDDETVAIDDLIPEGIRAEDDAVSALEDAALSGDVFADNGNGTDAGADGNPITVSAMNGNAADVGIQVSLASGALLTLNSDGTFSYDPNAQFESLGEGDTTTDTFSYTIIDSGDQTDTATVTVTITGANDEAAITGTITGSVIEDDVPNLSASGVLTVIDPDDGEAAFQPAVIALTYGQATIDAF